MDTVKQDSIDGKESPVDDVAKFVAKKVKLLNGQSSWQVAMLAKLRRGVGKAPGELPELWEVTLDGLPKSLRGSGKDASRGEWSVHVALTLYALHCQGKNASMSCRGVSLGAAVAQLRNPDNEGSLKRRFDTMLTAKDFKELSRHARSLVQLLRVVDVRLDYPQFARDVYLYQSKDAQARNRVRLRWGRDYYRLKNIDDTSVAESNSSVTSKENHKTKEEAK